MSSLALRRAGQAEAAPVAALLAAAGAALAAQGFRNWEQPYPLERVRGDITERAVFVVTDSDELVATFTLGLSPVIPYAPPPWPDSAVTAAYLNRMAVVPARQGTGLGRWCLAEVDREAATFGASAVRCDVLAINRRTCRFYEGHGYRAWGTRDHSGWQFSCYEHRIPR